MTITQTRKGTGAPSTWARMRLWAVAHAIDDLYQGLVPSVVPYFVLDRHYGYVAASGLTLSATLGSSIPQPFLGVIAYGELLRPSASAWPGGVDKER